jgi:hypothetical protein
MVALRRGCAAPLWGKGVKMESALSKKMKKIRKIFLRMSAGVLPQQQCIFRLFKHLQSDM